MPGEPQPLMGGAASAEPLGRGQGRRGREHASQCQGFPALRASLCRVCSRGRFRRKASGQGEGRGDDPKYGT